MSELDAEEACWSRVQNPWAWDESSDESDEDEPGDEDEDDEDGEL